MKKKQKVPKGHGAKYARYKDRAIDALLRCSTIAGAANMIGVGEKTLRRWMRLPAFQLDFDQTLKRAAAKTTELFRMLGPVACRALLHEMEDGGKGRVPAAKYVLDRLFKMEELQKKAKRDKAASRKSPPPEEQKDEKEQEPASTIIWTGFKR